MTTQVFSWPRWAAKSKGGAPSRFEGGKAEREGKAEGDKSMEENRFDSCVGRV